MELRQLHYFVTVVEEKTVTAAAEKLNMTQPPLTMQLHALERELDCALFRREGRRLTLTDAGQHLYRRAVELLAMCDNMRQELTAFRSGALGTLRIGVISSVQGTLFADWMRAYHARYPDVRISVSSANTYQLLSTLQNRQIDMAIIRTPFAADGLDVSFLKEEQIQAVGDERFFEGFSGEAASLHELAQTPLIVYRRWRRIILSAFEAAGVRPNILCVNDDARMTLLLTMQGLGVGLLHPSALPARREPTMRVLPLPEPLLASRIALVCANRRALPEPAALFWRLAQELTGAG